MSEIPTAASVPPSTSRVTDARLRELVDRARRGDTEAFGDLVDLHRHAVYRAALAALRSPEEAEDVTQAAFVAAFQKLDGFRGDSSFKTWVTSIAWRKALDRRRGLAQWLRRLMPAGSPDPEGIASIETLAAPGPSHEAEFLTAEFARHIERLVSTLPAKLRDTLLLASSGDHNYEEIATMLAIPTGTVKWRVSEARRLLKQKLVQLGYGNE